MFNVKARIAIAAAVAAESLEALRVVAAYADAGIAAAPATTPESHALTAAFTACGSAFRA